MKTLSLDRRPAKFRVESYTLAGVPCIIAGLNRHAGDFTMPSHWNVRALLDPCHTWIRQATEEEKAQHGKWYHVLNFQPAAVIHSNGVVGIPDDTIGHAGDRITVLAQAAQVPVPAFEEVPCADVDDIPTPPTPPPFRNDNMRCFENALFAVAKVGLETVNHLVASKSMELQSVYNHRCLRPIGRFDGYPKSNVSASYNRYDILCFVFHRLNIQLQAARRCNSVTIPLRAHGYVCAGTLIFLSEVGFAIDATWIYLCGHMDISVRS